MKLELDVRILNIVVIIIIFYIGFFVEHLDGMAIGMAAGTLMLNTAMWWSVKK